MKVVKRIAIFLGILMVAAIVGFVTWGNNAAQADRGLLQKIDENTQVNFTAKAFNHFEPLQTKLNKGVIIYPGAKVKPLAYGQIALDIATQGYDVFIVPMPLNLAVFGVNKADQIMKQFPEIDSWVIGGHSLGGTMAASYAYKHQDQLEGVFFLASYPVESNPFNDSKLKVISIYATQDGLVTQEDFEKSKELLPNDTVYCVIKGGNHAGFGQYGPQKGDNNPTIDLEVQQKMISDALLEWLK